MALSPWQKKIESYWYTRPGPLWLLFPLELLFAFASKIAHKQDSARQRNFAVPILVVGNISVGGTGKTPALINLLLFFKEKGLTPGVVSRGYGRNTDLPFIVNETSRSADVGEEPLLIYQQSACPVSVHSDRQFAAEFLLKMHPECNVILADDGLQHYKLKRDFELALVDAERLFGNGHLLPLGPLREKPNRLESVNWIVLNERNGAALNAEQALASVVSDKQKVSVARLHVNTVQHIQSGAELEISAFKHALNTQKLHAIAAIGHPEAFFTSLHLMSTDIETHSFPDHYVWRAEELVCFSGQHLICTSKDAVKVRELLSKYPQLDASHWYFLQVELALDQNVKQNIYDAIMKLNKRSQVS